MKKTIYICDRCGKEAMKLIGADVYYDYTIHGVISHSLELCPNCAKELVEISKKFYSERMLKELGLK